MLDHTQSYKIPYGYRIGIQFDIVF
eukprot:SAG11_NODE_7788_length_1096_cov_1.250752_1_plen_24_part_01